MAATIWNAVAEGRTRALRTAVRPGSPAAALIQLYGPAGLGWAVGMPPGEIEAFTTASTRVADDRGLTSGIVKTARAEYGYVLHWREHDRTTSVVEVLPYPAYPDDRFHVYYWWFGGCAVLADPPTQLAEHDEVTRLLVSVGSAWQGLPLCARALAAWWRLGDLHDVPLAHGPASLAAAVHRLIAHRAGDKGRFRDAAEMYRTDEAAVRRADVPVRKALALGAGRAW